MLLGFSREKASYSKTAKNEFSQGENTSSTIHTKTRGKKLFLKYVIDGPHTS